MECPSNKQYYVDELCVANAAVFFEGQRPDKLYWYECEHCHGFHLTHNDSFRDENYFNLFKSEIIKRNTQNPKKINKEYKPTTKEMLELRAVVVKNNKLQEILDWNAQYPGYLISTKTITKPKRSPEEIARITKMRDLVDKHRNYDEIIKWNVEFPHFPISVPKKRI